MRYTFTKGAAMKRLIFVIGLILPMLSFAEPPKDKAAVEKTSDFKPKATACAKKASLMGAACSYTTGMMAQRVEAEGKDYSYKGLLEDQPKAEVKGVAVPFTLGPNKSIHVIANEFVEELTVAGFDDNELELNGKVLDIQGTRFFLLERYRDLSL